MIDKRVLEMTANNFKEEFEKIFRKHYPPLAPGTKPNKKQEAMLKEMGELAREVVEKTRKEVFEKY